MNTVELKAQLRRLVVDNRLHQAGKQLASVDSGARHSDYRNQVMAFNGRMNHYLEAEIGGAVAPEVLARTRNQLSMDLLGLIDQFPNEVALETAMVKPEGTAEDTLKKRMFWLLIGGKLLVIVFAAILWSTGTFTNEQFISTAGILLPLFTAHLTLMVQDATKNRSVLLPGDKRVNTSFANFVYLLCFSYPLLLLFLLNLRGPGTITYLQFTSMLALAEGGLGAYLGKVVYGLFKE